MTNTPDIRRLSDDSMRVTIPVPLTSAKMRRAAFMLESIATQMEEDRGKLACPPVRAEPDEDPQLAAAAVLDDVRAVMLGRGREHGYKNEIVNVVSLSGGTMGVSVSRLEDQPPIVAIAFGATGARADMRERLGIGQQVPALSYVEITDFDREGVGHLLGAIKLAYPDMLEKLGE